MTESYHTLFPFLLDWSNSGGKTALHIAAQSGNTPFINLLCDFGAELDLTDYQGNTPLHYASAWGHLDTIKVLLERGCQFGARNFEGFTASDFAFSSSVLAGLEGIARGLYEERRNRRKVDGGKGSRMGSDRSVQQVQVNTAEVSRMRSESVGTDMSYGSGASGRSRPSPILLPPRPELSSYASQPSSNPPSIPSSRRPSQSQIPQMLRSRRLDQESPPPLPPVFTDVRPQQAFRTPSLPGSNARQDGSGSREGRGVPILAPPLPGLSSGAIMGSIGMRRANSGLTESSVGSGSGAGPRLGNRGPMI
jgi:hypothetical protein